MGYFIIMSFFLGVDTDNIQPKQNAAGVFSGQTTTF